MSKYTTSIYNILQNIVPDGYEKDADTLVSEGAPLFFDFNYPWYTDSGDSKAEFEKMYLTYYLNNEIGQETLVMHKQCIKRVIVSNIEAMRQKYQLLAEMPNIVGERKLTHEEIVNEAETSNSKADQNATGTSEQNDSKNSQSIHSDNPQATFSQNDYASAMDREQNVNESSVNSSTNTHGTTDSTRTGNTSRKLMESETDTRNSEKYFSAIENGVYLINTELILRCRKLYMQLW